MEHYEAMFLNDNQVSAILKAGELKAKAIGIAAVIAILDAGANLKVFHRMDNAVLGSIDISQRKAKTAVLFKCRSEAVWDFCKPGSPAPGLDRTNGGLAPYAGGIPLFSTTGELLGAVGVSGGTIPQDLEIAEAAAKAFDPNLK